MMDSGKALKPFVAGVLFALVAMPVGCSTGSVSSGLGSGDPAATLEDGGSTTPVTSDGRAAIPVTSDGGSTSPASSDGGTASPPTSDAGTGTEPVVDSSVAPEEDAGSSPPDPGEVDASTTGPGWLTFSENGFAHVSGVTSDTTMLVDQPNFNTGDRVSFATEEGVSALLSFDISAIPTDATVTSATIDLFTNFGMQGGTALFFPLLESWNENEATYNNRMTGTPWADPGAGRRSRGEWLGSISAATTYSSDNYQLYLPVDLVQTWVSSPSQNHGLLMEALRGQVAFLSSEAVLIENAPMLTVEYSR